MELNVHMGGRTGKVVQRLRRLSGIPLVLAQVPVILPSPLSKPEVTPEHCHVQPITQKIKMPACDREMRPVPT